MAFFNKFGLKIISLLANRTFACLFTRGIDAIESEYLSSKCRRRIVVNRRHPVRQPNEVIPEKLEYFRLSVVKTPF